MPARRLSRSVLLAVVPWLVPSVVAVVTVPITVRGLGDDSYGVVALVGAVAGYLALMQVGMGKGITRYVSMFVARGNGRAIRGCLLAMVAWFSGVGVLGGPRDVGTGAVTRHEPTQGAKCSWTCRRDAGGRNRT